MKHHYINKILEIFSERRKIALKNDIMKKKFENPGYKPVHISVEEWSFLAHCLNEGGNIIQEIEMLNIEIDNLYSGLNYCRSCGMKP